MFGYRRDEQGEIIQGDLMWDPGSFEVKQAMEHARFNLFGFYRNYQGAIVGTIQEACQRRQ